MLRAEPLCVRAIVLVIDSETVGAASCGNPRSHYGPMA